MKIPPCISGAAPLVAPLAALLAALLAAQLAAQLAADAAGKIKVGRLKNLPTFLGYEKSTGKYFLLLTCFKLLGKYCSLLCRSSSNGLYPLF